jgi:hypothetical protein
MIMIKVYKGFVVDMTDAIDMEDEDEDEDEVGRIAVCDVVVKTACQSCRCGSTILPNARRHEKY